MIPTVDQCFKIMDVYQMPKHIRAHSIMVAKVARVLSRALIHKGIELSFPIITAGALLHDIGKHQALSDGGDHSEIGYQICMELGMPQIAEIISQHVVLAPDTVEAPLSEIHLIYYSDKRVNHQKVVSLEERLAYILERYGRKGEGISKAIKRNFEVCKALEQRLFGFLDFGPSDVVQLVHTEEIGGNI